MVEQPDTEPSEPAPGEPASESPVGVSEVPEVSFGRTLLQLFIIPAFVVVVCVGVFFFFAWLVSGEKSGIEYLQEIRTGSYNRRWQAAFELSKIINQGSKERLAGLAPEMVDLFQSADGDDPRVRHYLAISLGHLGDSVAVPELIRSLSGDDATTRIYACWALGKIGDSSAVDAVLPLIRDQDRGVRKMAVYSLGALGDARVIPEILPALQDPHNDVAWNAAVALAQLGDSSGEARLLQMLDRDFLQTVAEMDPVQQLQAIESAVRASGLVGGSSLRRQLEVIADRDPNLRLRELALEALETAPQ